MAEIRTLPKGRNKKIQWINPWIVGGFGGTKETYLEGIMSFFSDVGFLLFNTPGSFLPDLFHDGQNIFRPV